MKLNLKPFNNIHKDALDEHCVNTQYFYFILLLQQNDPITGYKTESPELKT